MNSKERMMRVLSGERGVNPPAVFHSWGDYKVWMRISMPTGRPWTRSWRPARSTT